MFLVSPKPFTETGAPCGSSCSYLEAQPTDLAPAQWCTGVPGSAQNIDASGGAIGTGYMNTQGMIGLCTGGAGNEAAAPWGGLSDWFLPSPDELTALLAVPTSATGIDSAEVYWSSMFMPHATGEAACALDVSEVAARETCPSTPVPPLVWGYVNGVRPIRAF